MQTIINEVNRIYAFRYAYGIPLETSLYNYNSALHIKSISFTYQQGYKGFVNVKTINGGTIFYRLGESSSTTNVYWNLTQTGDENGRIIDLNNLLIEEITIELAFNHQATYKLTEHISIIEFNIQ